MDSCVLQTGGIFTAFSADNHLPGCKTPGFGITVKGDKLDLENYREDSLRITRLRVKEDIFSRATEEDKNLMIYLKKQLRFWD